LQRRVIRAWVGACRLVRVSAPLARTATRLFHGPIGFHGVEPPIIDGLQAIMRFAGIAAATAS